MFPLLPAIFLLLLNGPSGLDKMAHDGCLPETIKALHRQLNEGSEKEQPKALLKSLQGELILASLLAGSSDEQLSKAIADLLLLVSFADLEPPPQVAAFRERPLPKASLSSFEVNRLLEGFCQTARSRDGPVLS